jgi:hypothetical protein
MDDDIKAVLATVSDDAVKEKAVVLAFKTAAEIAYPMSANQAGGDFIALLLELFKVLLPILLEMLKPRS